MQRKPTVAQSRLDELWDVADPAGSEGRLRAAQDVEADAGTRAELETQIARALGLQYRFDEAPRGNPMVGQGAMPAFRAFETAIGDR